MINKKLPNYRTDKLIDVNKDKWIITEEHHEFIISKENFDEVQQILDRKIKFNKNNGVYYLVECFGNELNTQSSKVMLKAELKKMVIFKIED